MPFARPAIDSTRPISRASGESRSMRRTRSWLSARSRSSATESDETATVGASASTSSPPRRLEPSKVPATLLAVSTPRAMRTLPDAPVSVMTGTGMSMLAPSTPIATSYADTSARSPTRSATALELEVHRGAGPDDRRDRAHERDVARQRERRGAHASRIDSTERGVERDAAGAGS